MTIVSSILALIQAIPALTSLFEQLMAAYVRSQIDKMKKENRDAIKKAFTEFDQRELERGFGMVPGEASGLPGTIQRPTRPHGLYQSDTDQG